MLTRTPMSKMQGLLDLKQSVWLDYLSRGMTRSGELQALIDSGLRGMTSNPTIFEHAISLEAQGARPQRLLWASTGTKNPEYSDVRYVDSLIGADTITTVPPATLRLFEDHGRISRTLGDDDAKDERRMLEALANGGIDFADVNRTLENEGIEKFVKSFDALLHVIAEKRLALSR